MSKSFDVLSAHVDNLLYRKTDHDVLFESKSLSLRKSSVQNAGQGVFANEFIKSGTIFLKCIDYGKGERTSMNSGEKQEQEQKESDQDIDSTSERGGNIHKKINDLAYNGDSAYYNNDSNVIKNTNVGYLRKYDNITNTIIIYLYAIKDINKSEELSRHYSLKYWKNYDYWKWKQFPESKLRQTHNYQDLPNQYVHIDIVATNLKHKHRYNFYGKKQDSEYHYVLCDSTLDVLFSDPTFDQRVMDYSMINVSKNDFSPYLKNQLIGMCTKTHICCMGACIFETYYSISHLNFIEIVNVFSERFSLGNGDLHNMEENEIIIKVCQDKNKIKHKSFGTLSHMCSNKIFHNIIMSSFVIVLISAFITCAIIV